MFSRFAHLLPVWCLVTALGAGCSLLVDTDDLAAGSPSPVPDAGGVDTGPAATDATSAADAADAAPGLQRPVEGTYAYLATGNDFLSLGDQYANWGPAAKATVVHRGADCFTMSFTYRDRFTEELDYCTPRAEQLVQTASRRTQSFRFLADFVTARTTTTCTPGDVFLVPSPTSDTTLTHLCAGENNDDQNGESLFQTGGPYRFVGAEDVAVSGVPVRTLHHREDRTVTGAQVGTSATDWYFAIDRALPVKVTRSTNIKFEAVGITYIEKSELTLVSLVPSPLPDAGTADAGK